MGHRLSKSNRTTLNSPRNHQNDENSQSQIDIYETSATLTAINRRLPPPSSSGAVNILSLSPQDPNVIVDQRTAIGTATITVPNAATTTTSIVGSSTLASSPLVASSPSQVIIRIQLTKMETENNNNFDNTENHHSTATSNNIQSIDNNLNISYNPSIINLTISNNFVCDAAATSTATVVVNNVTNNTSTTTTTTTSTIMPSNNLNSVGSTADDICTKPRNSINCLNIVGDHQQSSQSSLSAIDLDRASCNTSSSSNRKRIVNSTNMNLHLMTATDSSNDDDKLYSICDAATAATTASTRNSDCNSTTFNSSTLPINDLNIRGVAVGSNNNSTTVERFVLDNCNGNVTASIVPMSHRSSSGSSRSSSSSMSGNSTGGGCKPKHRHDCNSGQSSLCAESGNGGDRHHCCHPKKTSSAYPSKLRCCECAKQAIGTMPSSLATTNSRSKNYNLAARLNSFCRGNSNSTATDRQPPIDTPPPPIQTSPAASQRAFFQALNPHGTNLILLTVPSQIIVDPANANGHSSIFPQEIDWLLRNSAGPVLCTPSTATGTSAGPMVHSQTDYSHCLVPDLEKITNSSFYWGKMDRYEAERLLEGKPEGTFLLRDSAQEEYLFSVTFRKYGRSLHARIEQLGHKFSFDCHDPGVYTASTVTGLLEHYKDPSCVMFFEPMLTIPLHRNFTFSLQQLCRATIVSHIKYDGINELQLPNTLKSYLKEYHYKYKVRETPLDDSLYKCS